MGTLYFHAQYRQAQPNHGWTSDWQSNGDPKVDRKTNLDGKENYLWLDATGRGHFVGVTMSVLQNQDGWWAKATTCFSSTVKRAPPLPGLVRRIISSVLGILAAILFLSVVRRSGCR